MVFIMTLTSLQEEQSFLKSDWELWLELRQILEKAGIRNLSQLNTYLERNKIMTLDDLNEEVRGTNWSFETTIVVEQLIDRVKYLRSSTLEKFYSSSQVGQFLIEYFSTVKQEQLMAIYLDSKNKVIAQKIIFQGSLNRSIAHPREIFQQAIQLNSACLIIAHNHPSGETTPSKQDIDFSQRMVDAGELIGIECLDHFIVGGNYYLSLKEEDLL